LAIWRAGSLAVAATARVKGPMSGNTRAAPSSLKAMCATATRLASAVAPTDAVSAVTHVPMLAPSTIATAPPSGSSPCWANASASPSVAADDVTSALKAAPTSTPTTGLSPTAASRSTASGSARSGPTLSRISLSPRNMRPSPSTAWPTSFMTRRRATKLAVKPSPTRNGEASVIRNAMSCTVRVVPMSAPRITPSVWRKLIRPADTKPISMSVVAAEDWMIAVIAAPEATA